MDAKFLTELYRQAILEQRNLMHPSRFRSWEWAREDFRMALEWLNANPNDILHGESLNDTPGMRVWRLHTPHILGNFDIIYKFYETAEFLGTSMALKSVLNAAALKALDISVPPILACGETRVCGELQSAFLVTQFLPNRQNGAALAPGGPLREQRKLRMTFCKTLMRQISLLHQCHGRDTQIRAKKFLFQETTGEKDTIDIDWIDVAYCDFDVSQSVTGYVPQDLIKLFVDLRLNSDEIQEIVKYYIDCWPNCPFTVEGIWDVFTKMKPIPLP